MRNELVPTVSHVTVWRAVKNSPNIVRQNFVQCPPLNEQHKQYRLRFAEEHIGWKHEWSTVSGPSMFKLRLSIKIIWSDEKRFNLDGPDGFSGYWRDLRSDPRILSKRSFGGGGCMVWSGFSSIGKLPVVFIRGNMNSEGYQEVLANFLLPYLEQWAHLEFTYMQDNAPAHASRSTRDWLQAHQVPLMEWPPRSPDLNPIENAWGQLARKVYENGRQFECWAAERCNTVGLG